MYTPNLTPAPRVCKSCGCRENDHPYRHIFDPLGFGRTKGATPSALPVQALDLDAELQEYGLRYRLSESPSQDPKPQAGENKSSVTDDGRDQLAAGYIKSLLAIGDLRRFVMVCEGMGRDRFGACHWCKRHLGSKSHADNCEFARAVKVAKECAPEPRSLPQDGL